MTYIIPFLPFLAHLVLVCLFIVPPIFILRSKMSVILKGCILGFIEGFAVMFYDFDGFLNAGGPSTPITNSINKILGLDTVFILPLLGMLIGFVICLIIYKLPKLLNTNKG